MLVKIYQLFINKTKSIKNTLQLYTNSVNIYYVYTLQKLNINYFYIHRVCFIKFKRLKLKYERKLIKHLNITFAHILDSFFLGSIFLVVSKFIFYIFIFTENVISWKLNLFIYILGFILQLKFDFLYYIREINVKIWKILLGKPYWQGLPTIDIFETHTIKERQTANIFAGSMLNKFFIFIFNSLILIRLFIFQELYLFIIVNFVITLLLIINKFFIINCIISIIILLSRLVIYSTEFNNRELFIGLHELEIFNDNECIAPTYKNSRILGLWISRSYKNRNYLYRFKERIENAEIIKHTKTKKILVNKSQIEKSEYQMEITDNFYEKYCQIDPSYENKYKNELYVSMRVYMSEINEEKYKPILKITTKNKLISQIWIKKCFNNLIKKKNSFKSVTILGFGNLTLKEYYKLKQNNPRFTFYCSSQNYPQNLNNKLDCLVKYNFPFSRNNFLIENHYQLYGYDPFNDRFLRSNFTSISNRNRSYLGTYNHSNNYAIPHLNTVCDLNVTQSHKLDQEINAKLLSGEFLKVDLDLEFYPISIINNANEFLSTLSSKNNTLTTDKLQQTCNLINNNSSLILFPTSFLNVFNFINPYASKEQALTSFDLAIEYCQIGVNHPKNLINVHIQQEYVKLLKLLNAAKKEFEVILQKEPSFFTFSQEDDNAINFQLLLLSRINYNLSSNLTNPLPANIVETTARFYEISPQQVVEKNLVTNIKKIKKDHQILSSKHVEEFNQNSITTLIVKKPKSSSFPFDDDF